MISWVAMDRIVEKKCASDADYRRQCAGRPQRSTTKVLTDGDLLAKLRSFDIHLDRPSLERLCRQALSAEEIAGPLLDRPTFRGKQELESDWIWICLTALWQRWFPDEAGFETLDDKMQAGYGLLATGSATAACRVWLDAWSEVLRILDKSGIQSIDEFDDRFRGTQSLFNWIQVFEGELWNAGLEDRQFFTARIAVCEEGLRRFPNGDEQLTRNRRGALAESYFELGDIARAEELYRGWLKLDPRWGWGWIGWSNRYLITRTELRDSARAEQLLREGLAIPDVRDRSRLAEKLAQLCEDEGRVEEAHELWLEAKISAAAAGTSPGTLSDGGVVQRVIDLPPSPATNSGLKVGRNHPCPCGSGRKFKKCCGF